MKKIRHSSRKRPNRNFAMAAAPAAIPVNPNSAAMIAITKKIMAQRNMSSPPYTWIVTSSRCACLLKVDTPLGGAMRFSDEMSDANAADQQQESARLAGVVERNVRSLVARRELSERRKSLDQRFADAITRFTGSMRFVYIHALIYGTWIVINLPEVPTPKFDRSFVILAMVASVEAIFLTTFVLMTQNRMSREAESRAELDLQISLLAEHEVTRLITLVKAIAEKLEVEASKDPELPELQKDVEPERVLD